MPCGSGHAAPVMHAAQVHVMPEPKPLSLIRQLDLGLTSIDLPFYHIIATAFSQECFSIALGLGRGWQMGNKETGQCRGLRGHWPVMQGAPVAQSKIDERALGLWQSEHDGANAERMKVFSPGAC